MRNTNRSQQSITELTEALEQLRLAQDNLQAVLNRIREEEEEEEDTVEVELPIANVVARVERVHPFSHLAIGDRVKILNPKPYQQKFGTVIGATRTGFIKVKTPNGNTDRRFTNNLSLLS